MSAGGVFCVVATPLYLRRVLRGASERVVQRQVLIGSCAFPIWAIAVGGGLEQTEFYRQWVPPFAPTVLLILATFVVPLAELKEGDA